MLLTDYSYIAGIIYGEGTITLTRNNIREFKRPIVSVSNTDKGLIDWLYENLGGKVRSRIKAKASHKQAYEWRVESEMALLLLANISSFLKVESKRKRALLLVQEYKLVTPRNGKYTNIGLEVKKNFETKFFSL